MYGEEESWSYLVTEILVGFRLPWETITGCLTKADSFTYYGMLIPWYSYHHLKYKLVKLIFSSLEFEFFDPNIRFNCSLANLFWFPVFFFFASYCNDCRDLDLCRDMALLAQDWHCAMPQCGQPYDREVMENALLQIVRQRERLYHLQDLVCIRCNQVKAAHLAEQCVCAGSFRCKEDESDFRSKMQIFLNIANRQGFQLLQECTSWILEVQ